MARARCETSFINTATGAVVSSGSAIVYLRNTNTPATLYADDHSGTTVANPVTLSSGRMDVWLNEGSYDITVSGTGFTTYTLSFEAVNAAIEVATRTGLTPTAVKTSAYTAAPGDLVPVDISGGNVTVTLPAAPLDKSRVVIKIIAQNATPNTLTVSTSGSDVFNKSGGNTSMALKAVFQSIVLQYTATPAIWYVQSSDSPLGVANGAAQLDATSRVPIAQIPAADLGANAQTLAANGAVTIDASKGNLQLITLQANATSSSITNGTAGQMLTVQWTQDGTGSRTVVWPTACKFAGGTAPTVSTSANYRDAVTFAYDGTNWNEISRALAVR